MISCGQQFSYRVDGDFFGGFDQPVDGGNDNGLTNGGIVIAVMIF